MTLVHELIWDWQFDRPHVNPIDSAADDYTTMQHVDKVRSIFKVFRCPLQYYINLQSHPGGRLRTFDLSLPFLNGCQCKL